MLAKADPLTDERVLTIREKRVQVGMKVTVIYKKTGVAAYGEENDKHGEICQKCERFFRVKFPRGKDVCINYNDFGRKVIPEGRRGRRCSNG